MTAATAATATTAATAATAVPAHAMEQAARDPAQLSRESVTAGALVGLPNILKFVKLWESVVPAEARSWPAKIFVPFLRRVHGAALAALGLDSDTDITNVAVALERSASRSSGPAHCGGSPSQCAGVVLLPNDHHCARWQRQARGFGGRRPRVRGALPRRPLAAWARDPARLPELRRHPPLQLGALPPRPRRPRRRGPRGAHAASRLGAQLEGGRRRPPPLPTVRGRGAMHAPRVV